MAVERIAGWHTAVEHTSGHTAAECTAVGHYLLEVVKEGFPELCICLSLESHTA